MKIYFEIAALLVLWLVVGWIFCRAWMRGCTGEYRGYENSIYLVTLVTRSQSCPYFNTFGTSDNEK